VIPRLEALCFNGNRFGVSSEFVVMYVQFHVGSESHDGWGLAEAHWEKVVNMVLDTDAVEADAQGDTAIAQAVGAAAVLLRKFAEQDGRPKCPVCTSSRAEERIKRERV
jgi:stage V sporulation protein SpoVS